MSHGAAPPSSFTLARNSTRHDGPPTIDMSRMRAYRVQRIREQLRKTDCGAVLLYDVVNMRYATDTKAMSVYSMRSPDRYCVVTADGPVVMFEKPKWRHLTDDAESIDEIRTAVSCRAVSAGRDVADNIKRWAAELIELLDRHGGGSRRLALDHCEPTGAFALAECGVETVDGRVFMDDARAVKSAEEIKCMRVAIAAAEIGMSKMRDSLAPGITENELWAILAHTNIAMGGEWLECRLLTSGWRTNPWLREASDRVIQPGELVAFDTDMVGPLGYSADLSRTYFCEPGTPTAEQRSLYRIAYDEIHHNMGLLKAGLSLREFAERAFTVPEAYFSQGYSVIAHGVGLSNERPYCHRLGDLERQGDGDTVLEANMVMCVESYAGAVGGDEGVKLEQQVLINESGCELLSSFPFETALLGSEV